MRKFFRVKDVIAKEEFQKDKAEEPRYEREFEKDQI